MDAGRLDRPDFRLLADSLRTMSDHVERCENLPAVDGSSHLLQAVQALTALVQDMRRETRRDFDQLHERVDGIQRRVMVAESNGIIRLENSTAVRAGSEITALLSIETGEVIEDFPQTVDGISTMTSADVNRVLVQLGAPINGSVAVRRRRLLLAIGVTTLAV